MSLLSRIATQRRKGHTTPHGLPALDDHTLAHRVTALLLAPEDHARAQRLTVGLKEGLYGQLKKADRDWLIRVAAAEGALPTTKRRPRPRGETVHVGDFYSTKATAASTSAESLIASQVPALGGTMPTPPGRRSA